MPRARIEEMIPMISPCLLLGAKLEATAVVFGKVIPSAIATTGARSKNIQGEEGRMWAKIAAERMRIEYLRALLGPALLATIRVKIP